MTHSNQSRTILPKYPKFDDFAAVSKKNDFAKLCPKFDDFAKLCPKLDNFAGYDKMIFVHPCFFICLEAYTSFWKLGII